MTGSGLPSAGEVHGAYHTYLTYSDLLADLEFKNDNTVLAKAARTYETNRDLLTAVENYWRPNGSNDLISGYAYVNDDLARRSSVVNTGVAFAADRLSLWSYNDRNELAGSDRREGNDPGIPRRRRGRRAVRLRLRPDP